MNYLTFKYLLDKVFACVLLLVFSPILIVIALAIKSDSKGPVFFKQRRIGKDKMEFMIWKFRTMLTETPKDMPTHLLDNPDAFITKLGKFLRKSSLDELPQLFNILMGEMSFIGPRPALWNQYDLIAERDKYHANDINPGLTGWAQVNGRDELPIDVKARLDGDYMANMSPVLDIKIILLTLKSVVKREGVREGSK